MAQFKLIINDSKTGKACKIEIKDDAAKQLIGRKIKEHIKGELFDMPGYEFEITGGADHTGVPMRSDIEGMSRKKVFAVKGIGMTKVDKGIRQRKLLAGNTIHDKTAEINMKVLKYGPAPLNIPEKPAEEKKE